MKWRLLPLVGFLGLLAAAVTLIIFHTRGDRYASQPAPSIEAAAQGSATQDNTVSKNIQDLTPAEPVPPPPTEEETPKAVKMYTYEIVRQLPHDATAFTQGIEYEVYKGREVFWESTGIYKKSQLREVRSFFQVCVHSFWNCVSPLSTSYPLFLFKPMYHRKYTQAFFAI